MVGGGDILAGGFVSNESDALLSREQLDPVRRDSDLTPSPLAMTSRLKNSVVSGSDPDAYGLNGSRSPNRGVVPDLGTCSKLPDLEVQEARGNTEFASSICNELLRLLGQHPPPQGIGDKAHNVDVSLHEIVVSRVHQQHVNCSVSDSVEWTQYTFDLVRMTRLHVLQYLDARASKCHRRVSYVV